MNKNLKNCQYFIGVRKQQYHSNHPLVTGIFEPQEILFTRSSNSNIALKSFSGVASYQPQFTHSYTTENSLYLLTNNLLIYLKLEKEPFILM